MREYPYKPGQYPYLESIWDEKVANSKLNPVLFFEVWGKVMGDKYGVPDVTLERLVDKETGEVVYSRDKPTTQNPRRA